MKKEMVFVFVAFFAGAITLGQVQNSFVRNGSFEYDGHTIDYITATNAPRYWCDVNMMNENFGASLWRGGLTDGSYYLQIYSSPYGEFSQGDTGYISQQVNLDDANEIIFDIELESPWNPQKRSAVIAIDYDVVWESNSVGTNVAGLYLDQRCTIPQEYKDGNMHTLSLGVRVNDSVPDFYDYYADWDYIKFDAHCGGFGYLPGDLSQDCFVNLTDLAVLGLFWMTVPASEKDDLNEDGIVNEIDLGLFAGEWLDNTDWENAGQAGNSKMELLESDFDLSGQVDLGDLMIFSEYWLSNSDCDAPELSGDEVINFEDFAVFAQQWLRRDWLYYVE